MTKHNPIYILLILAVIAVGYLLVAESDFGFEFASDISTSNISSREDLGREEIAPVFPADFPFENTAQNFLGFFDDPIDGGEGSYVANYQSSLSFSENESIFSEYFSKSSYSSVEETIEPPLHTYLGQKEGYELRVTVQQLDSLVLVTSQYRKVPSEN